MSSDIVSDDMRAIRIGETPMQIQSREGLPMNIIAYVGVLDRRVCCALRLAKAWQIPEVDYVFLAEGESVGKPDV